MVFSLLLPLPINFSVQNFHCLCPYSIYYPSHFLRHVRVKSEKPTKVINSVVTKACSLIITHPTYLKLLPFVCMCMYVFVYIVYETKPSKKNKNS